MRSTVKNRAVFCRDKLHTFQQNESGGHETANLQSLCGHRNGIRGKRPMEYLRKRLKALYGDSADMAYDSASDSRLRKAADKDES